MKACKIFIMLLLLCKAFIMEAQNQNTPKLVVGIVVDQMRYDYIYKFWENLPKILSNNIIITITNKKIANL